MVTSAQQISSRHPQPTTYVIAHTAFVLTGIVTVLLGPLLPALAAQWGLNDVRSGYLSTAHFLGAFLATIASSLLLPLLGFRWSIAAGQVLMALGVAVLTSGTFTQGLLAVFCYGIGIGLTIPTVNLLVAERSLKRRSSALNILNFCWSSGAVACPLLLAAFHQPKSIRLFLDSLAGFLILLTVGIFLSPTDTVEPIQKRSPRTKRWLLRFTNPATIVLAALFFIYVGTESSLGVWLASYAKRESQLNGTVWITVPSYFYGALWAGRAVAPLSLQHFSDSKQARLGALLALISTAVLLLSRSIPGIAISAFVIGLGLSTLYPIAIGFLSSSFGPDALHVGGYMFALSALGGASIPLAVGFTSTMFDSLKTALFIPLLGLLAMLLLFSSPRLRECA